MSDADLDLENERLAGDVELLREECERLTATLAARDAEVAGLKAIIATHDLCHNQHGKVDARAFTDGCSAEQRKLYGCAPDADALAAVTTELDAMREALEFYGDEGNYKAPRWGEDTQLSDYPVMGDRGDIARAARAKKGEASNGQ